MVDSKVYVSSAVLYDLPDVLEVDRCRVCAFLIDRGVLGGGV